MTTKTPPDDLRIPAELAAAIDQAAADVPRADHDLAGVHRRAHHLRRRRHAVTGVAAAAALVVTGAFGARLLGTGDDSDVVVPPSVNGPSAGEPTTVFAPESVPAGWTLETLETAPFPDDYSGPRTSQLFAVDGPVPLGRGVVVTSGPTELSGAGLDVAHTVRDQPAHLTTSESGRPVPDITASWFEGDVAHDATAIGLTQAELLAFLDSLTPNDDPATGFSAPAGTTLPELDVIVDSERTATLLRYRGPDGAEITVTGYDPGPATLIAQLLGDPQGDGLVIWEPRGEHPEVTTTLADGWTVGVVTEVGPVDPAVVDTMADSIGRFTVGELIENGTMGEVTALAAVDAATVQVNGTDERDLTLCVTPESGDSVCGGVVDDPDSGFTSAALVVDGRWTIVTVSDGDEPGEIIGRDGPVEPTDPIGEGEVLRGPRAEADGRIVEVVTVPDGIDSVLAMSPMTDAGSTGTSYYPPE